jgi:glycine cleavage system aminomethyltransferase T
MGYIDKPFNKSGTEIKIKIRKKELRAKTVKLPIYKG